MKAPLYASLVIAGFCAAISMQPASGQNRAPAADQHDAVAGSNAFATDLYGRLRSQPGNLFFSPESISTTFAMAYAGARGETAVEMGRVFHYSLPADRLHPAMGALLAAMNAPHDGFELHVADALWAQHDETFLESYLQLMRSAYGAALRQVDFKSSPEAVRGTINQWVEKETKDRIQNLLPPGSVTSMTRLVLTNAIYFKGSWLEPFDKRDSRNGPFHVSSTQAVQAPFMHGTRSYRYYDGGTFQALEMPYKGNELSMVVLLPQKTDGLSALEDSFTAAAVAGWIEKLQFGNKVVLTFPRFTMTQRFELNGILGAMGMAQAFDARADFSGMTGKRGFMISAAVHKAFVDVNEKGTEAAAATGIAMTATAVHQEPPPIIFNADHPFLFLIRDTKSGSILFVGRVVDPTK